MVLNVRSSDSNRKISQQSRRQRDDLDDLQEIERKISKISDRKISAHRRQWNTIAEDNDNRVIDNATDETLPLNVNVTYEREFVDVELSWCRLILLVLLKVFFIFYCNHTCK